ncbi:outer membrane beta-barrel protein [Neolewinella agarilytica]|uniref:outer membrane beta-barrel protein n=1 Tax=Neolewinella agarilytica TaxID=478744 RepID=UPI0023547941|nr:outer membrane beta-barrel protein [Neolewinella agarilytica]
MRFLFFFLLSSCSILSAQYSKGTVYFGQESGIEFLSVTDGLFGGFGMRARGGYFVRDRLLLGAAVEAGDFASISSRNQFQFTPFARYYFPLGKSRNAQLFSETGLTINFDEQAALSPSIALGGEYQIAPGAMLTATVRHNFNTQRLPRLFTLGVGLNVLFGEQHSLDPALGHVNKAGDLLLNPSIGNAALGLNFSTEYAFATVQLDGGFFLSNHLALMVRAGYNTFRADIGTDILPRNLTSNETVLGMGLRYQINNGKQWQPYVQGGLQRLRREQAGNQYFINGISFDEISFKHLSFDVGAGVMYHLSTTVALDLGLSWLPIIQSQYPFIPPGDQVAANFRIVVFPSRSGQN